MSYLKPLFQSVAKCETINMKRIFNSHLNLTHFHIKGFTLSLTSKDRSFGTWNSLFNWWNKSLLPSILCEVAPVPSHNIQTLHFFHFIKGAWKDEIYSYRWKWKKKAYKNTWLLTYHPHFPKYWWQHTLKRVYKDECYKHMQKRSKNEEERDQFMMLSSPLYSTYFFFFSRSMDLKMPSMSISSNR